MTRPTPRIAAYRDIREADLVGREGHFIAEGEVVVRVLLTASLHGAVSLLLAEKRVAALQGGNRKICRSRSRSTSRRQEILDEIAGFPMHRGILALGRRAAFPSAKGETELAGLRRRASGPRPLGHRQPRQHGRHLPQRRGLRRRCLVILDSDCCDPLYRKAIRVSVGAALTVPFARLQRGEDAIALLAAHGFAALALTPGGARR